MSRELLASQKNNSGILLDPRTKLAVLITIAVFILGGSYEGIMQYYIIVLAAIPLLLLLAARKWKGAVLYILIFWRQPVPWKMFWPVPPDRCSKLYCSSHRWYPAKVYAQCGYGIFRCDNNNGQ